MTDIETLRAEIRKLSSRAIKAKMDLHDLSEELPAGWETIPEVSSRAREAYAALEERRLILASLEGAVS